MREELQKIFRGKLVLCLILLSVCVNLFIMCMQREKSEILHALDNFSVENGVVVSPEATSKLKDLWEKWDLSTISWQEYENDLEKASNYYSLVTTGTLADGYCYLMRLEGQAANFVHEEFCKLGYQIDKAKEQALTYFPPYQMHTFEFLSTYLLFALNMEGVLSATLLTLYSVDFERSSHTLMIVYSTRKGKKVIKDKLFASVFASLVCFLSITALSLVAAAYIFPIKTLLSTLISNPLVTLKGVPSIAQNTLTIGMYILLSLGISTILVVVYSLMSFTVGLRTKNGYFGFGALIVLLGIMKVISVTAPTSTMMFFWSQYNPIDIVLKAGTWFLYNSNNFSPLGYEIWTLLLWATIGILGCICSLQVFSRKKVEL